MRTFTNVARIAVLALGVMVVVGCAATDPGLTTKVKAKLAADDTVSASQIDVSTHDKVVTLSGTVGSEAERDRAVQLARETEGVADVENRLMVRNLDGTGDAPDVDRTVGQVMDDAGITAAVKAKLLDDPVVRGLEIDVDTKQGVVFLTGSVRSAAEKERAIDIARGTEHVRDVQADLLVEQG
jgi:hyperosmotically inducible protein